MKIQTYDIFKQKIFKRKNIGRFIKTKILVN